MSRASTPAPEYPTPSVLVRAPSGMLLLSPVSFPGSEWWPEGSSGDRRVYAGNLTALDCAIEYRDGRALLLEPDPHDRAALIALGAAGALAVMWRRRADQTLVVLPFDGDWLACERVLTGPPPTLEGILDAARARNDALRRGPYS